MDLYTESILTNAVNNVAPKVFGGGKKARGPNATADFIYQVWTEKALMETENLPMLFEMERQKYENDKKLIEETHKKGLYGDSIGWSEKRDFKWEMNLSRATQNYLQNVIGPFLGLGKRFWEKDNSKHWKKIKKMIIDGDKLKINQFKESVKKRILEQAGRKITFGTNITKSI